MTWKNKATVVLVDDHPGALMAAYEIMREEFDIVATVVDGDAAVEAVSLFHPDMVVLDIGLPGMDGFETARKLKETPPGPKIVFLTVMEDEDYASAARVMGGSYVVKRRMRMDLLTAAREALDGHLYSSPILPSEPHVC